MMPECQPPSAAPATAGSCGSSPTRPQPRCRTRWSSELSPRPSPRSLQQSADQATQHSTIPVMRPPMVPTLGRPHLAILRSAIFVHFCACLPAESGRKRTSLRRVPPLSPPTTMTPRWPARSTSAQPCWARTGCRSGSRDHCLP